MMFESDLMKMYHAWLQGDDNYTKHWMEFVKWAAIWNKVSHEIMEQELLKYKWFKHD